MGFPGPAADFAEQRISLDERIVLRPAATYFMRAGVIHYREGILKGAMLVVDASLNPCDGSLLVCSVDGEFHVKRYRTHPEPHLENLENLENGKRERLRKVGEISDDDKPIFGVITYIINDARYGEFDDYPLK
ncbi:LexA family transcriptional regulator [Escherichia coli]|uniref:HumD family translesion DNA polymerase n=1 Tax=Escherichia coli TaxID=562 RepID=UPI000B7EF26E|nr:S24 family peptidase [Escherichia coli]EIN5039234.1 LexA family transcriptional regulator [Escherichia coli]QMC06328.1 LexA family transcriptional regulator [Escherichia coli]QMC11093.1 LexA family transcriptional regulator [Escherichia coli]QMC20169.1 LexA family transcriptional regulator [Escherichia coli]